MLGIFFEWFYLVQTCVVFDLLYQISFDPYYSFVTSLKIRYFMNVEHA